MPLDLRGFMDEPNQWAGLYHAADQLEKQKLQQQQLALQQQSKRAAAGTFLQNYLDPKDMLTGTDYDPMLLKGIEAAKQQGAKLVAAGADAPTLMMALGPMVNKLSSYSANAKTINKRIDEQLKGMRDSGLEGYNFSALKQEALKHAFYKEDANGQMQLDPDSFDPSQDYVAKAIQKNPLAVTTEDVFDEFAKKAEKRTTAADITTYTPTGTTYRHKADLTAQAYMVPEVDAKGVTTGFVPKHDIATEQGHPLFHNFEKDGKTERAPVRLLDEEFFDKGLKPAMQDRIRGMVQEHLKEYSDKTGKPISIDSPEAKLVGRAIAYDMLNVESRKGGSIKHLEQQGKPSQQELTLRWHQTPEYLQNEYDLAAKRKAGRNSIVTNNGKANAVEVVVRALKNDSDILQGEPIEKDGSKVYDITPMFPGGGLSAGRGADFKYKGVFVDPGSGRLIVEKEQADRFGIKSKTSEVIEKKDIPAFLHRIAQANGIGVDQVKLIMQKLGYGEQDPDAADFNNRKKSWHDAVKGSASAIMHPFGKSF